MDHRGTYTRGYLPHRDYANSLQAITFRLADSVPKEVILKWRKELAVELDSRDTTLRNEAILQLHRRIAKYEDAGRGSCILALPEAAGVVQEILIQDHGKSYRLHDWCIMPNHVHVMIRVTDGHRLGDITHRWKGSSSFKINRVLGREGPLWSRDFFDRFIRNEQHYHRAKCYIRDNPVKASLCTEPADWPFSSAGVAWQPDP